MRYIIFFLTVLIFTKQGLAQNLVTNGSFESCSACPIGPAQFGTVTGWTAYFSSPDYFNPCTTAPSVGVPTNNYGYQYAASGQSYAGIFEYFINREYIATTIPRLTIGAEYEVSMSVCRSNNSAYASNGLGVYFFDDGPAVAPVGTIVLPVTPQVSYVNYGIIYDTMNWIRLTGTFTADSAYDNLVIGGFVPTASLNYAMTGIGSSSYMYIDSVVVRLLSKIYFNYTDTLLCAGDTFSLNYTLDTGFHAGTGNQFRVQLSDATGSFAAPVVIGSNTSNIGGSIFCTIPINTATGTGYHMRVISTNPQDSSAANIKKISIGTLLAKPVANSNSPVCAGSNLNLFASTTTVSSALKWSWTGPNSFSSNLQNPGFTNVSTVNSGSYIVTAALYGCRAKDTTNITVVALPSPTGIIATSNSPVCVNDTLKLFSTNSSSGTAYSWTGPNNFTASSQNTSIVHPAVAAGGDYIVSATLNGCSVKDTVTVIVKPTPANFSASDNSPVCVGGVYNMNTTTTSTGVTWNWTGPFSFSSTTQNTALSGVTGSNAGDYIITATLNGCSIKDTLTLVVNPLPAKPVASSNAPVCSSNTLNLTSSTSTTGVSYSWTGPNSFSAATQNPSVTNTTAAAGGDYIVTVTTTAGCSAKDTETVVIEPVPVVNATNSSPVCEGSVVNIFATATPTGTFSWTGPGSYTATTQNPTLTNPSPAASGDYIVSVTLNGCTGKDTTTVLIKPQPITPLTGSNTPVCVGMGLNLTAASNAGASYSWTGPNSFSSALQTPTRNNVVLADAGTYSVTATLNGCTSIAGTTTVMVNPAPFVTIYSNPADSICQGSIVTFVALPANTGAPAYKWTKNSSPSVLSTNNTFITSSLNNNDIIRCEMTDPGKCGTTFSDTSNELKMTVLPLLAPSVSISSNPATPLSPYELVTFTAIPVNAGNNPKYQWQRNSSDVIGATSNVWATQQLSNNDSVSVVLTSDYKCPQPKTAGSNKIKVTVLTGVNNVKGISNLALYPNPNNGSFIIKGTVNSNKAVRLQILNAQGQLVYATKTLSENKELYEQVNVQHLANGVYVLRIDGENNIRFTIQH